MRWVAVVLALVGCSTGNTASPRLSAADAGNDPSYAPGPTPASYQQAAQWVPTGAAGCDGLAPAGVPRAVLEKISNDWAAALKTPEMQAKLKSQFVLGASDTPNKPTSAYAL